MNLNNIQGRLKRLFSELGFDVEAPITMAEIESYAFALEWVKTYYDEVLKRIFIPVDGNANSNEYQKLVGRYIGKSPDCENLIINNRLSTWGSYSQTELDTVKQKIGNKFECTFENGVATITGLKWVKNVGIASDFIFSYIPATYTVVTIHALKSRFYDWDKWGKTWRELDSYGFSFDMIESMEVINYE